MKAAQSSKSMGPILLALSMLVPLASADGPGVIVQLEIGKAAPRAVETETEHRIAADYRLAWTNIAQAFDANTQGPLDGLFVGPAKKSLADRVSNQQRSGLSTRYSNQNHKVEAVLYSPEGDVIELHDTAAYRLQLSDRGKLIHDDQGIHRYVVLMTPAADRWVVRQLVEVSQF